VGLVVLAAAAGLLLCGASVPVAAQDAEEAGVRSTLDGVYTPEQAERGRSTYVRVCAACHALDWYQGDQISAWTGAPVYNLFEVIRTSMPKDNPGSLKRREYVDMLAYILALNGMPPGSDELPVGSSRLRRILFQMKETP
jgi:mono/diheme cytochrome c family protein